MPRSTYVWRDGALVEKGCVPSVNRLHVISDTMATATSHPCTGEMMDSKSRFRRITREHGCIEMGNDRAPTRRDSYDASAMKRDIVEAIRNPDRSAAMSEGWNGLQSWRG